MSNPHDAGVAHLNDLSDRMRSLLFNGDDSDITFIVENERVPAHTLVLTTVSDHIRARLLEGSIIGKVEVILHDTSVESLKLLLSHTYTGCLSLAGVKLDTILETLKLSLDYGIEKVEAALCQHLQKILSEENAFTIYDMAQFLDLEDLSRRSLDFLDQHAAAFLESDAFLLLPAEPLRDILQRDSFFAEEIEIFKAVRRWAANRAEDEGLSTVVEAVRLPLIDDTDLLNIVKESNLVPADRLLDAVVWQEENQNAEPPYRGSLVPEVDLVTADRGAKLFTKKHRDNVLRPGIPKPCGVDQQLIRHGIGDPEGITVDLGGRFIINHIVLRLFDEDPPSYSYYVEVSVRRDSWRRVIDYSNYCCRSLQNLYFEPRVCRYIRVVGTHSPSDDSFPLITVEAMFTEHRFQLSQGIYIPRENVASKEMGARVIEGDGHARQVLIDGNVTDYDEDLGYVYHGVGPGSIIIQLAQPYIICSMKMLLWDLDSRWYSYCIETSVDMKEWTQTVNRVSKPCKSWQLLNFEPLPVVFIKIVGTASSANDISQCVHFECPAGKRSVRRAPGNVQEAS